MIQKRNSLIYFQLIFIAIAIEFLRLSLTYAYSGAGLEMLSKGEASLPYQNRVLIPAIVSLFSLIGLDGIFLNISTLIVPFQALHKLGLKLYCPPNRLVIFLLLDFVCLSALLSLFYKFIEEFIEPKQALFYTIVLILALVFNLLIQVESRYYYPYDIPCTLFLLSSIYFTLKSKKSFFIITLFLGSINKETALFFIYFYYINQKYYKKTKISWLEMSLFLVMWFIVRLIIWQIFRGNHGASAHPNIIFNIPYIFKISTLPTVILACLGLLFPAVLSFMKLDNDIKKLLYKLFIAYLICFMLFGKLIEYRAYTEFLPLIVILGVDYLSRVALVVRKKFFK